VEMASNRACPEWIRYSTINQNAKPDSVCFYEKEKGEKENKKHKNKKATDTKE